MTASLSSRRTQRPVDSGRSLNSRTLPDATSFRVRGREGSNAKDAVNAQH